jgi:hypothetical protein
MKIFGMRPRTKIIHYMCPNIVETDVPENALDFIKWNLVSS